MYIIKSDDGYWNTEEWWVEDKKEATLFNEYEKETYGEPNGYNVEWVLAA